MVRTRALTLLALILLAIASLDAWAGPTPPPAKLIQLKPGQKIDKLQWKSLDVETEIQPKGEDFEITAILEGTFDRPGWTLMLKDKIIKIGDKGAFREMIPLTTKTTNVELVAVGIRGEVETFSAGILVGSWDEIKSMGKAAPPKRWFASFGGGPTYISYFQSRRADLSQIGLTVKGSFNYLLFPPKWDFGVSAYFTALPITSPPEGQIRFLGMNMRFGYIFPQIKDPWRLSLLGGFYYTSTFASTGAFGFKNMFGPQIYPGVRRTFKNGDSMAGYFKFSPISDGFSIFALSNNEIAGGVAYIRPLKNGRSVSVSLDVAKISISIGSTTVSTSSISLGAGYGL